MFVIVVSTGKCIRYFFVNCTTVVVVAIFLVIWFMDFNIFFKVLLEFNFILIVWFWFKLMKYVSMILLVLFTFASVFGRAFIFSAS